MTTPETTLAASPERRLVERVQQRGIDALHGKELDILAEAMGMRALSALHDKDWMVARRALAQAAAGGWDSWQQRMSDAASLKPLVERATTDGLDSLQAREIDALAVALHMEPLDSVHDMAWTRARNAVEAAATKGWHRFQLAVAEAQPVVAAQRG